MILSTNQELRIHIPSNAIDDISLLQGILDNSEKDTLSEKLGERLYARLCEYYNGIDPSEFYMAITKGTYSISPWMQILIYSQRIVANDAMARYARQQRLSVNSAGLNMATSNDYPAATDKAVSDGVQGYKMESAISLNNLLLLLESWAKIVNTPGPISERNLPTEGSSVLKDKENVPNNNENVQIEEIVTLWQESKYYYLHQDLLIPTCSCLLDYMDGYENRDKFIRLIPELRFIQRQYVQCIIGKENVARLLISQDSEDELLLDKVRYLMLAYLKERTAVLSIDNFQRQIAHDDAIALKAEIVEMLSERKKTEAEAIPDKNTADKHRVDEDFKNNQLGSKIFVTPMLF